MPLASLSTFAVMKPGPTTAKKSRIRNFQLLRNFMRTGLVALVAATLDEGRGLGVGSSDKDAGDPHDVELQAGGVEALDLLVLGHNHLAALVAAFLRSRLLVFNVVEI